MTVEIRDFIDSYPHQTPPGERVELIRQIEKLRRERKAVLLVHNYQLPEIQELADFLGDSLGLSRKAVETDADVIVFCGVHFMAQTAKLLNPERPVLLPDSTAGCPLADTITPTQLEQFKAKHPGCPVVAYVNTTAEVKAGSDICCTSANSAKIVQSLAAERILFVPDKYLAAWTQQQTDKEVVAYNGVCPTHALFTAQMLQQAKEEHPDAVAMCHPECPPQVTQLCDVVASTSGMVKAAEEMDAEEFIIATEWGLACRLAREHPDKRFYIFPEAICHEMKKTTLPKLAACLQEMSDAVHISEDIAGRARRAVQRMLEVK